MIKWMTGKEAEEADVLLCAGVMSLFSGVWMVYPPAALIALGLVFGALSYLSAGVSHGMA